MADVDHQPTAFVLMPFAHEFEELYEQFIAVALSNAGYSPLRADDIQHSQNIMTEIVSRIRNSDLIVADLTGSNPNVYYELGIAHSYDRPTILLTQEMENLPFDLRAYRIIEYSVRFSDVFRAKETLQEMATHARSGDLEFGNPVSDHDMATNISDSDIARAPADGEPGFLDHWISVEEGTINMTACLSDIGARTQQLLATMLETSSELERLNAQRSSGTNQERRSVIRRLAQRLDSYANFLNDQNTKYSRALEQVDNSLHQAIAAQESASRGDSDDLKKLLGVLAETEKSISEFRNSLVDAETALIGIPNVERRFNEARSEVVAQLRRLVSNSDRTLAMMLRARALGEAKLASGTT